MDNLELYCPIGQHPVTCGYLNINFFLRFYLFERERARTSRGEGGRVAEGDADFPLSREPGVGLDPRPLGSYRS